MRIALTGASGFIGSHLAEYLVNQNHQVTCLLRKTSSRRWLQHLSFREVLGDVAQPQTLQPFVQEQDVVIHAAGITKAINETEYLIGNTESTKNLLAAIRQLNPQLQRFVLISSQAAAGPSLAKIPLGENALKNPITAYGRSKALAEEITLQFGKDFPVTIIRPPTVYGPRDRDVYAYFRFVNKNLQPILGKENTVSLVYVKNLVAGIAAAMTHPHAIQQCYFITDDGQYTWSDLADMIAHILNKRPIKIKIPNWLIQAIAGINSFYSNLTRKPVLLNREKLLEMRQPYWLAANEKAKAELGFFPPFTTDAALRETAVWYLENGWL